MAFPPGLTVEKRRIHVPESVEEVLELVEVMDEPSEFGLTLNDFGEEIIWQSRPG